MTKPWKIPSLEFQRGDISEMTTNHKLRKTPEGRKKLVDNGVSMKGYRKGKGNGQYSAVPFTERRFVSWDGEGYTENEHHYYMLFGNSDRDYVHSPDLSTAECLTLICEKADLDAIHFGFAFSYDVNMILKDLQKEHLRYLKENKVVNWKRWRINYLPRKWFMVTDILTHRTVRIWDTWSFFMTSAVRAWEEYGVTVSEGVLEGKKARGTNSYLDLFPDVFDYWAEENDAYVQLMGKLRDSLHSAGLYISAWHGPGAIASYSMQKHDIDKAMAQCPVPVNEAAQYAYGGGRFELFKVGRANRTVYEYDINSAYPYAISQLPNLARGHWQYVDNPTEFRRFAVYRVSLKLNPLEHGQMNRPMPFFNRDKRGQISFPCVHDGWVWSPEIQMATRLGVPGIQVFEGWEFVEDDETDRPFAWVAESYHIRLLYKEAGNQAQYALKLQLNSMYGKMAQRVGWNKEKGTPPKWHQLEWAGWVTSYCRSMVFRAAMYSGNDLVAFETDAIFSTRQIDEFLQIGDALGNWSKTVYTDFIYLQSGCRFGLKNGEWKEKYRGFDKGSITLEDTLAALGKEDPRDWTVTGTTSRFIGFAQALHQNWDDWRRFKSGEPRTMRIGGEGKRKHMPRQCAACRRGIPANVGMHQCGLAVPVGGESHKHPLPWKEELNMDQKAIDESRYEQQILDL